MVLISNEDGNTLNEYLQRGEYVELEFDLDVVV